MSDPTETARQLIGMAQQRRDLLAAVTRDLKVLIDKHSTDPHIVEFQSVLRKTVSAFDKDAELIRQMQDFIYEQSTERKKSVDLTLATIAAGVVAADGERHTPEYLAERARRIYEAL